MADLQSIVSGQMKAPPMRYQFVQSADGLVRIFDTKIQEVLCDWVPKHAQMMYMLYKNMHDQNPFPADQMMYGAVISHIQTLIHQNDYPSVAVVTDAKGITQSIVFTDKRTGLSKTEIIADQKSSFVTELKNKVDPKYNNG